MAIALNQDSSSARLDRVELAQLTQAQTPQLPDNYYDVPSFTIKVVETGVQVIREVDNRVAHNETRAFNSTLEFADFDGNPSEISIVSPNGQVEVFPDGKVPAYQVQNGDRIFYPQSERDLAQSMTPNTPDTLFNSQIESLNRSLPGPVQTIVDTLTRQYNEILNNPNVQQASAQMQQWANNFQRVIEFIPEPLRQGLVTAIPGVGAVSQALQAKQAWDELPDWAQDTIISVVPGGDGVDLAREAYNAAIGKGADPVIITLGTIGLAGDLGWLDGVIPDPADGVNVGAAMLKAAYKKMGSPAREAMQTLIKRVSSSADALQTFQKRLGSLLPNINELMQHPDSLPRLFNLSDAAFSRAMRDLPSLQEAIRRAEFSDRFIGRNLQQLSPADRQALEQAYRIDRNGVIRRKNVNEGYTQLRIEADGTIREGAGRVSDRLSNPTQMKRNYAAARGAVPEGHQLHHLVPDSVVRDHPLTQVARSKAGYNLDESSNLLALPYTREALQNADVQLVHLGSHPNWSRYVTQRLDRVQNELISDYGSLDNVPPDVLQSSMRGLEQDLRQLLTSRDINRLKQLGVIDDSYNLDGQTTIRLSQRENSESQNSAVQVAQVDASNKMEPDIDLVALVDDGMESHNLPLDEAIISSLSVVQEQYPEMSEQDLATLASALLDEFSLEQDITQPQMSLEA